MGLFPQLWILCDWACLSSKQVSLRHWPRHWSTGHSWTPNLLIDFLCCVAWDRSQGQGPARHSGSDCSPRPLVWNLSSLMHQSTLVSLLPKHDVERIEGFCGAAFERRSNSSFRLIIGPNKAKPERSGGHGPCLVWCWKIPYSRVGIFFRMITVITNMS